MTESVYITIIKQRRQHLANSRHVMSEGFLGNLASERIVLKASQFSKAQNQNIGLQ